MKSFLIPKKKKKKMMDCSMGRNLKSNTTNIEEDEEEEEYLGLGELCNSQFFLDQQALKGHPNFLRSTSTRSQLQGRVTPKVSVN